MGEELAAWKEEEVVKWEEVLVWEVMVAVWQEEVDIWEGGRWRSGKWW